MAIGRKLWNLLRGEKLNREMDEELESHLADAVASGREAGEAKRALGSPLRHREASRDARIGAWLDSLRGDFVFGLRQLWKNRLTSSAAVLSLALATGSCMAAFQLIDAMLLRPLPVAHADRLYEVSRFARLNGRGLTYDSWAYPSFLKLRAAVKGEAELLAISHAEADEIAVGNAEENERAYVQYVSGWMFDTFGLKPELGRLLQSGDDEKPGGAAVAVVSHDFWKERFGGDPAIVGKTFRMGERVYEIVGVTRAGFTGTQPGTLVDIFVPVTMHPGATHDDWSWHSLLAIPNPGTNLNVLQAKLEATSNAFEQQRMNGNTAGMPAEMADAILHQKVLVEPAASGASELRTNSRRPLEILAVLVALVLLIACANVANLLMTQAASRAREMALRVSIGGGRGRLIQLMLVQSACLAATAAVLGAAFARWAGPMVVGMINPRENPARLVLAADWRVAGFGLAIVFGVTLLFGLAPALRASSVDPVSALKGGENPHAKRRLMLGLIGAQVAFCFLVVFVASLLVTTFRRLSNESTGFNPDRVLILDVIAKRPQPPEYWAQAARELEQLDTVESAAMADDALLSGGDWNNFISVEGMPPNPTSTFMRRVSPNWLKTMQIPLLEGRDFLPSDAYPGKALVNEAFVKAYFAGKSPVGRTFEVVFSGNSRLRFEAVGVVGDVRYQDLREGNQPTLFLPFRMVWDGKESPLGDGKILVRAKAGDPMALVSLLREELRRARPEFRVSRVRSQMEINRSHTVRERLLATLAAFFAGVALLLAGVGLYGVLHYYVLQRRREIGIRIAVGAGAGSIARLVTAEAFGVLLAGSAVGFLLGKVSVRFMESLFFQVQAGDPAMVLTPLAILMGVAVLAAAPAVVRAVRIDPARMLRVE